MSTRGESGPRVAGGPVQDRASALHRYKGVQLDRRYLDLVFLPTLASRG
jgi:hypothetical protein